MDEHRYAGDQTVNLHPFGFQKRHNSSSIDTITNGPNDVISGFQTGIYNAGTLGTLANSGTIQSIGVSNYGLDNTSTGTISTISNLSGGTIAGQADGINNEGIINGVGNAGLINGIENQSGGNIGSIVNTGQIGGIFNDSGTIGTILNNEGGTINLGATGVANESVIFLLNNSGTIAGGGDAGIGNYNMLGTLINSGVVSSTGYGLWNDAVVMATLDNTGIISSTDSGIYNQLGSIGTITNNGTISSSSYAGITNDATIGTITNLANDLIFGNISGIANEGGGTVGLVTNSGTIYGAIDSGLDNQGIIGTFANLGSLHGATEGVFNSGGTIGTFTNSGTVSGASSYGIFNSGSIGTFTNQANGTISGAGSGIYTYGTIGNLANSGTITSTIESGIDNNQGVVGTLANLSGGVIQGYSNGIANYGGSIATLSNNGLITGGYYGIFSNGTLGTIGTILNTGTISGGSYPGIDLQDGGTTIFNGGTIANLAGGDAIYFGAANELVLTTGSAVFGTIDGGTSASQIVLQGDGSLDNDIVGFDEGSAMAITPGADWTGTGNWTIATVTNDGVLQAGRLGTPLTLNGDYLQNADGTLRVLVTPTQSTQFNISGTATLAGTVSYVLAPGSYTPHTYPYLTAATVNGGFTTMNYGQIPTGLAATQYLGDPTVDLVITGPFTVAPVTPASPATQAAPAPAVVIAPADGGVFGAQTQALAQSADADTASLLDKAVSGGAASSPACAAEAPLSPANTATVASQPGRIASALASMFCGAGGWVEATGSLNTAHGSAATPSNR
jgi:hypothetical protein